MNEHGRATQLEHQAAQAHRLAQGASTDELWADLTALGKAYDRELAVLQRERERRF